MVSLCASLTFLSKARNSAADIWPACCGSKAVLTCSNRRCGACASRKCCSLLSALVLIRLACVFCNIPLTAPVIPEIAFPIPDTAAFAIPVTVPSTLRSVFLLFSMLVSVLVCLCACWRRKSASFVWWCAYSAWSFRWSCSIACLCSRSLACSSSKMRFLSWYSCIRAFSKVRFCCLSKSTRSSSLRRRSWICSLVTRRFFSKIRSVLWYNAFRFSTRSARSFISLCRFLNSMSWGKRRCLVLTRSSIICCGTREGMCCEIWLSMGVTWRFRFSYSSRSCAHRLRVWLIFASSSLAHFLYFSDPRGGNPVIGLGPGAWTANELENLDNLFFCASLWFSRRVPWLTWLAASIPIVPTGLALELWYCGFFLSLRAWLGVTFVGFCLWEWTRAGTVERLSLL